LQWEALDDASQHATRGLGTRKGYPYISGFGKFVVYVFTIFEDLLIVA
jgi:hypothetical protein